MRRCGFVGISAAQWLRTLEGVPVRGKPVILTFDDGYSDSIKHVFPQLMKLGFSATVYVVTGELGGTNRWDPQCASGSHSLLSENEIRNWSRAGIDFGGHTCTHPNLTQIPLSEAAHEIQQCREQLEDITGGKVMSFAYPYGAVNVPVASLVRDSFPLAFTCEPGMNDEHSHRELLHRTMVRARDRSIHFSLRVRTGREPWETVRFRIAEMKRNVQRHMR